MREPGRAVRRPAGRRPPPPAGRRPPPATTNWALFVTMCVTPQFPVFGHPVVNIGVWVPIFQQRGLVV